MTDPYVGKLTYFRVYSGKLEAGSHIYNATNGKKERIGRILQMHANHREEREMIGAGEIAAAVGLKFTTTGDTLTDQQKPILLEAIVFPEPVIEVAVEPKTKADQDKLATALGRLSEEDPTFRVKTHEETGQTLIAGMGELHLEIIVDRLLREFKVDANVGKPQVAYRETITKSLDKVAGQVRPPDGRPWSVRRRGHRGRAERAGRGLRVRRTRSSAARSRRSTSTRSTRASGRPWSPACWPGSPSSTSRSTLVDGSYHEVDSSEMSFKVAGSMAIKNAMQKAGPVLLEPVFSVEVVTPEEYMGDVMGDLNSRRGRIEGMEARGNAQVISARVPLSEMFGYATDVRSMTQGRATYTMQFLRYEEVPKSLAEQLTAKD